MMNTHNQSVLIASGIASKTNYFAVFSLCMLFSGCAGYTPGEKAYWDDRVRRMCQEDGGVTVYEEIQLSRAEFKKLGGLESALPLPSEADNGHSVPYFQRRIETKLHESNPEVVRAETQVVRRADGKVLGRSIRYWRRGGDFPTGIAHDSSFVCPDRADLTPQIFVVKGDR